MAPKVSLRATASLKQNVPSTNAWNEAARYSD